MNFRFSSFFGAALPFMGFFLLLGYALHSELAYARLKDPTGIKQLADFYERFGRSFGAVATNVDGIEYIELTGPLPPIWSLALPSGPPVYVFDKQGKFVDWCSDLGERPNWNQQWRVSNGASISDSEIRLRFGLGN